MKKRTNSGKVYEVFFHVKGDNTLNTINAQGEHVRSQYTYYVYAVNEKHARQIAESYDEQIEIIRVEEQYDAISQHYAE